MNYTDIELQEAREYVLAQAGWTHKTCNHDSCDMENRTCEIWTPPKGNYEKIAIESYGDKPTITRQMIKELVEAKCEAEKTLYKDGPKELFLSTLFDCDDLDNAVWSDTGTDLMFLAAFSSTDDLVMACFHAFGGK